MDLLLRVARLLKMAKANSILDMMDGDQRNYLGRGFRADWGDDPVHIKNVPLSFISVSQRGLAGAKLDVINNAPSRTEGPVQVWHDPPTGNFSLTDGYHRFVEAQQRGAPHIDVHVIGSGYHDTYRVENHKVSQPGPEPGPEQLELPFTSSIKSRVSRRKPKR